LIHFYKRESGVGYTQNEAPCDAWAREVDHPDQV